MRDLPSWDALVAEIESGVEWYNNRPHESLPLRGDGEHFSPAQFRRYKLEKESTETEWLSDIAAVEYNRVVYEAGKINLLDNLDLTVLAIVMPVMLKALALTLPEGGLLGTATMLGAMLGSILFGLISENRGRRFALVLALCWLGIGMGGAYFINGWLPWMVLRFVTGLAIGGVWGP